MMDRSLVRATLLGWIAAMAIDVFLNAGVFTSIFKSGDPFILSPEEAFIRIPAGFAALLLLVVVESLLIFHWPVTSVASGARIGIIYGVTISSGTLLGLWSITVASAAFLFVWVVDMLSELTIAGIVISSVRSNSRHVARWVIIGAIACLIGGVIVQNISG
ncbi:MAG TPA: hypothetical protein VFJ63_02990 [Candidatus Bathyarchaeia archaeon]|nr:hypothetical protein [Candidatus Bathyarchaeia archaeon]